MIKFALAFVFVLPMCASVPPLFMGDSASPKGHLKEGERKRYSRQTLLAIKASVALDPRWSPSSASKKYVHPNHPYFPHTPLSSRGKAAQ